MFHQDQLTKSQISREDAAESLVISIFFIAIAGLIFRFLLRFLPKTSKPIVVNDNKIGVNTLFKKENKLGTGQKERTYLPMRNRNECESGEVEQKEITNEGRITEPNEKKEKKEKKGPSSKTQDVLQKLVIANERKRNAKLEVKRLKIEKKQAKLQVKQAKLEEKQAKLEEKQRKINSTIPKAPPKTTKSSELINTIKSEKQNQMNKAEPFSNKPSIDDHIIKTHRSTIDQLYQFYQKDLQLNDYDKQILEALLNFERLALLTTQYSSEELSRNFLLCARVGIDIQFSIKHVCTPLFINDLHKHELSTLLFACFLHDANANTEDKIDITIVNNLLVNANLLYEQAAKWVGENNYQEHLVKLSLFSNQNDKYANNSLKESKYFRYLLDAASFYHFEMSKQVKDYSNVYVYSNDESIISPPQKILFRFLKKQFKSCEDVITVSLEKKINVASYNADILIVNNQSNFVIDIEYDGLDHFYKTTDANGNKIPTNQYKREYIARDQNLMSWDVAVFRCTSADFIINPEKKEVMFISTRLNQFIEDIKRTIVIRAINDNHIDVTTPVRCVE